MDSESTDDVVRLIDKMAEAGWIRRSVTDSEKSLIGWTPSGQNCMRLLQDEIFKNLRVELLDQTDLFEAAKSFPAPCSKFQKAYFTTPGCISSMEMLRDMMFNNLKLEPNDESAFFEMLRNYPGTVLNPRNR